jgi:hypothetical protein
MFPVGDEQYSGFNRADSGAVFGKTVVVYYDPQKPGISALQDFSDQRRSSSRFAFVYLVALVVTVAFIIRNGIPSQET